MPTATAQALGALTREFRPPLMNVIAGYIIAVLLLIADYFLVRHIYLDARMRGFQLPWIAEKELSWTIVVVVAVAALVILGMAGALVAWMWSLRSYRVGIYEHGILTRTAQSQTHILWTEVAEIHERITYERLPVAKGAAKLLVPKVASKSYSVRRASGEDVVFEPNSIKNLPALAKLLRSAAKRGDINWVVMETH